MYLGSDSVFNKYLLYIYSSASKIVMDVMPDSGTLYFLTSHPSVYSGVLF